MLADPGFWLVQGLNSLQLSMLLFLLSVGLTVIFGLMNFVNLAHGSLYALGALIGYSLAQWSGSFWFAFVAAPLLVALIGAGFYVTLIDRLRAAGPMNQVLVTFGLIFVLIDVQRYVWGSDQLGLAGGTPFAGAVQIFGEAYPAYRLFIIAVGLGVFALLYLLLEHTRLGAEVRAGVEARFDMRMGRWHDRPIGPHPMGSYQIAFAPDLFAEIVPWLALNRRGLTVFIHPETGDHVTDHSDYAIWLGEQREVDLSVL